MNRYFLLSVTFLFGVSLQAGEQVERTVDARDKYGFYGNFQLRNDGRTWADVEHSAIMAIIARNWFTYSQEVNQGTDDERKIPLTTEQYLERVYPHGLQLMLRDQELEKTQRVSGTIILNLRGQAFDLVPLPEAPLPPK